MEKTIAATATEGGISVIMAGFFAESIGHMMPWLVVTCAVILCDLVVGLRKSLMMDEEIRFSSACRRTMGKMVSYFMFVIMVVVIDVAADGGGTIDKYACLLVCFIEFTSIISNILKPKGYKLNFPRLVQLLLGVKFKLPSDDTEDVIEDLKEEEKEEKKPRRPRRKEDRHG